MKICIIGWYGTETLGDRGILIGIIKILYAFFGKISINICSLNTFYTEHSIFLDKEFINLICNNINIVVYDFKSVEMYDAIKNSDIVVVGGGPLMDILEMNLLLKAFKIAKKYSKKTIIFGCGIGPISKTKFYNITRKLIDLSDLCIFRDNNYKIIANNNNIYTLPDPAVVSALIYNEYIKLNNTTKHDYIAVSLREFPKVFGKINDYIISDIISDIVKISDTIQIKFIPMNTFFLGGDDREYYCKLIKNNFNKNIELIFKPLKTCEMFDLFSNAKFCIGMRYHSVVFQTIVNGNNYIIDYTNPKNGKIIEFIESLNTSFYNDRYVNIQTNNENDCNSFQKLVFSDKKFQYFYNLNDIVNMYIDVLQTVFV